MTLSVHSANNTGCFDKGNTIAVAGCSSGIILAALSLRRQGLLMLYQSLHDLDIVFDELYLTADVCNEPAQMVCSRALSQSEDAVLTVCHSKPQRCTIYLQYPHSIACMGEVGAFHCLWLQLTEGDACTESHASVSHIQIRQNLRAYPPHAAFLGR